MLEQHACTPRDPTLPNYAWARSPSLSALPVTPPPPMPVSPQLYAPAPLLVEPQPSPNWARAPSTRSASASSASQSRYAPYAAPQRVPHHTLPPAATLTPQERGPYHFERSPSPTVHAPAPVAPALGPTAPPSAGEARLQAQVSDLTCRLLAAQENLQEARASAERNRARVSDLQTHNAQLDQEKTNLARKMYKYKSELQRQTLINASLRRPLDAEGNLVPDEEMRSVPRQPSSDMETFNRWFDGVRTNPTPATVREIQHLFLLGEKINEHLRSEPLQWILHSWPEIRAPILGAHPDIMHLAEPNKDQDAMHIDVPINEPAAPAPQVAPRLPQPSRASGTVEEWQAHLLCYPNQCVYGVHNPDGTIDDIALTGWVLLGRLQYRNNVIAERQFHI